MRLRIERRAEQIERRGLAHVEEGAHRVVFHRARGPSGDGAREFLEHGQRALAAAEANRVRHFPPRREDAAKRTRAARFARLAHGLVADEIAEIRHHPVGARFDEPVFVKLRDVGLHCEHLFGDDAQQIAQLKILLRIAIAIDRRQQLVEAVGVRHGLISLRMSVSRTSGEKIASCAGRRESVPGTPAGGGS